MSLVAGMSGRLRLNRVAEPEAKLHTLGILTQLLSLMFIFIFFSFTFIFINFPTRRHQVEALFLSPL